MNINALKALVKLAENNCDFGIHKELGIPRSSLWTFIDELEKQTNLQLVVRRKRHNSFTEEAEKFLPFAVQLISLFDKGIEEANSDIAGEASGEVLIATTPAVATTFLIPSINTFQKSYPYVRLKIIADDMISSSTEWMADIILRPIEPKEHLDRKWFFTYEFALFASQAYLEINGVPGKGDDLLNHSVIGYGEHPFSYFPDIDWHLKGRWGDLPRVIPSMTINSTASLYIAASEGMGICSAAELSNTFYKRNLVRILPYINGPTLKSYFCTKKKTGARLRKNIEIFQKFFEKHLKDLGIKTSKDIDNEIDR